MKKITFTLKQMEEFVQMPAEEQRAVVSGCRELAAMGDDEIKAHAVSPEAPDMLRSIHGALVKRIANAERRRERKAKEEAKTAEAPVTKPVMRYDNATLLCAESVAALFNNGVAFRDHAFRTAGEIKGKFEYELDGTMQCIVKLVRRLLKQVSRIDRTGIRALLYHYLRNVADESIESAFATNVPTIGLDGSLCYGK